jgi:response regulator of citrate/malate metabolism
MAQAQKLSMKGIAKIDMSNFEEVCFLDDDDAFIFLNTMILKYTYPHFAPCSFNKIEMAFNHILQSPEKKRLMFLDLNIGLRSGFELLDKIQHLKISETTVVMLSCCEEEEFIQQSFTYENVLAYIFKPLTIELLEFITSNNNKKEFPSNLKNFVQFKHE